MVQFVSGGVDVINNFFYAQPTEQDVNMFQQNHYNILQRMTHNVGQTIGNFYNTVVDQIRTINYDSLKNFARNIERKVFGYWESDEVIIPLYNLHDLQFPPHNMIRFLMANPTVRTMYHQNLVAGYDDKYVDLEPGKVGHDHYDYQMVMQGMEYVDEEGDVCYTTYEDLYEGTENSVEHLTHSERLDITKSWETMNGYLEAMGEDPTSQYSGML